MKRFLIVSAILAGFAFSASPSWAFGPARRVTHRVGRRVAVGAGIAAAAGAGLAWVLDRDTDALPYLPR